MTDTNDLLRQRFAEACAERDAILAKTVPLRATRDELLATASAVEVNAASLDIQIADLEAPLFDVSNEIARLSRALGGKTGPA